LKEVIYRIPQKEDGKKIHSLVKGTGVLDVNSEYLYLLQSTHFKNTCSVAEADNEIVGFISGYIHPENPEVLFIWQVGVDSEFRGQSIAKNLLTHIIDRELLTDVKYIYTTISPSNISSQKFFEKFANSYKAEIVQETMFELKDFNDAHEDEVLYKIGPFK
jgi:L-2,4-diaminobutyric acid acetyltransferase